MISLDSSILAAVAVFLVLIFALDRLLFRPLVAIQRERESRTTGLVARAQKDLEHYSDLFNRYEATIRNARMEGYRRQEQVRSEALAKRAVALDGARKAAEQLVEQSRATIQTECATAREQLGREAETVARGIAASILQRPA